MIDKKMIIAIFVTVLLVTVPLAFFLKKDSEKCDEHVVLEDGSEFDCRNVASYSNGMSFVKMCDGEEMTIPTHRIKEIRKID